MKEAISWTHASESKKSLVLAIYLWCERKTTPSSLQVDFDGCCQIQRHARVIHILWGRSNLASVTSKTMSVSWQTRVHASNVWTDAYRSFVNKSVPPLVMAKGYTPTILPWGGILFHFLLRKFCSYWKKQNALKGKQSVLECTFASWSILLHFFQNLHLRKFCSYGKIFWKLQNALKSKQSVLECAFAWGILFHFFQNLHLRKFCSYGKSIEKTNRFES